MQWIRSLFGGVLIGVSNIIPGVSGGTMAVVLGIYDKLIAAVSSLRKNFVESILFLIPIGIGAGAGILLFSTLIKNLLTNFPMATNFFFLGLIVGSIPMIFGRAVKGSFRPILLLPLLLAFGVMLALTFFFTDFGNAQVIRTLTWGDAIRLLICSAVAAACMILPGVSGSMVLMILGVYTTVLTAISELNLLLLAPVAVGVLIGIFGGAKGVDLCLRRAPQGTYCAILGLIIGSLAPVFRNSGFSFGQEGVFALFSLAAGVAASALLALMQRTLAGKQAEKGR